MFYLTPVGFSPGQQDLVFRVCYPNTKFTLLDSRSSSVGFVSSDVIGRKQH